MFTQVTIYSFMFCYYLHIFMFKSFHQHRKDSYNMLLKGEISSLLVLLTATFQTIWMFVLQLFDSISQVTFFQVRKYIPTI